MNNSTKPVIGVIGAGTMGAGIAQMAATKGHEVTLFDIDEDALINARITTRKNLFKRVEKGKLDKEEAEAILDRISLSTEMSSFKTSDLVIEAVVEKLSIKQKIFAELEEITSAETIFATNTSSLSVTAIGAGCKNPARMLGLHFFNPAFLMPLVEVVAGLQTDDALLKQAKATIDSWGKTTVLTKDTPGFIVNRVARPFYGEAIRIYEEGVADFATIDWAMREFGEFRMGPFELMDFIGNDVNFAVTESVFEAFFYDPRYKPSLTQKRLVEAGRLGRKAGAGYYQYKEGVKPPEINKDQKLGQEIFLRVLVMLINEAADAVFLNIASVEDVDLAMTRGVNYPKGLLKWADELGIAAVLSRLDSLYEEYAEDRYRPSPLLKRMLTQHKTFY